MTNVVTCPERYSGAFIINDAPTAFANIGATQTVVWYRTKHAKILNFSFSQTGTGTLTIYKTMADDPVDGTVGTAQTHDTLTAAMANSLMIGPGWNIGLAWARTSGNCTIMLGGEVI